jgi:fucose 4-O-acetylase-like acetyltransferase
MGATEVATTSAATAADAAAPTAAAPAKKRIGWIDISKGIAIILVLLGHSIPSSDPTWQIVYSFHMPLFFFLAGYTFRPKEMKGVLKSSALRLLVPYCICFLILSFSALLYEQGLNAEWVITHIESFFFASAIQVRFFDLPQVGIIWFFWALFASRVFLNFVISLFDKRSVPEIARFIFFLAIGIAGGVISRFIFLPLAIDLVFATTFFMYLGYLFKTKDVFGLLAKRASINILVFVASLAVWILCLIFMPYSSENLFSTRLYGNPISALAGSMVCFYVAMFIEKFIPVVRDYLLFMGTNSIIVLFIHAVGGTLIAWSTFPLIAGVSDPGYFVFIGRTIVVSLIIYLILLNPLVPNKK